SKDLEKIVGSFKEPSNHLEFKSHESTVFLERKYFRGVMYLPHKEKPKSIIQENIEDSEEIGKIQVIKNSNKPKVVLKDTKKKKNKPKE
ncbi:hypothetical protein N9948_01565, partial [bacterium]|nr:hypothetical protein [bacterium]